MGKVKSLFEDEQEREYQRRFDEIAYERGLHPDDDAEEIEQILFDENEAAYERYQESLMETGGPDDSWYRRQMKDAGRGHLLK